MKLFSLASGSSGNAYLVYYGGTAVLLDAGLSGKRIIMAMESLGPFRQCLQGIFVSHEHVDHSRGAGVLSRMLNLPLYMTRGTWQGCRQKIGAIAPENVRLIKAGSVFNMGSLELTAFPLLHDGREPVNVVVDSGRARLAVLTDTGVVNGETVDMLATCDGLVLEANHDPDMLAKGPYPHFLKRRIRSEVGHLSNQQAAEVARLLFNRGRLKQLQLGHLSEVNNTPELAAQAVFAGLGETLPKAKLDVLPRHVPGPLLQL